MFSLIRVIDIVTATADSVRATANTSSPVKDVVVIIFILLPLTLCVGFMLTSLIRYLGVIDKIACRVFDFLTGIGYYFRFYGMSRLGYRTSYSGFSRLIQDGDCFYKILVRESIDHWGKWTVELYFVYNAGGRGSLDGIHLFSSHIKTLSPSEAAVYYESRLLQRDIELYCSHSGRSPVDSLVLISSRTPRLHDEIVKRSEVLECERDSGHGLWYEH